MKRYLLDTNTASDLVNRRGAVQARADAARRAGGRVGTCTPVLAELVYGVEKSASRASNLVTLRTGLAKLVIWTFDRAAAEEYGRIMADLVRRGRLVGEIDVMTAAVARVLGNCTVVTSDTDFLAIPGLTVEDWRS